MLCFFGKFFGFVGVCFGFLVGLVEIVFWILFVLESWSVVGFVLEIGFLVLKDIVW